MKQHSFPEKRKKINLPTLCLQLKIPYQTVAVVSGALNNAAAKKYDLEG